MNVFDIYVKSDSARKVRRKF